MVELCIKNMDVLFISWKNLDIKNIDRINKFIELYKIYIFKNSQDNLLKIKVSYI